MSLAAGLLKRFKKACNSEKLKDATKTAAYYEKPSYRQRRKRSAVTAKQ
jgi:ribosomal protein S21